MRKCRECYSYVALLCAFEKRGKQCACRCCSVLPPLVFDLRLEALQHTERNCYILPPPPPTTSAIKQPAHLPPPPTETSTSTKTSMSTATATANTQAPTQTSNANKNTNSNNSKPRTRKHLKPRKPHSPHEVVGSHSPVERGGQHRRGVRRESDRRNGRLVLREGHEAEPARCRPQLYLEDKRNKQGRNAQ